MQFIGIKPGVLCLIDLGFAYLDDGKSTLRLHVKHFDELLAAEADSYNVPASVAQHSRFFSLHPTREAAMESLDAAQWSPALEGHR